jgi:isopenicillin-N epimerase
MSNPSRWDRSPTAPDGAAALALFQLAPEHLHLNHGSYGAVPKIVSAEQDRWRARIEGNATEFFADVLPGELRRQAGIAAQHFGGQARDWVFVENATSAVNGVLASIGLRDGDEILTTSHAYGAVLKAMQIWASRFGAKVVTAAIPVIVESEDQIVCAIEGAITAKTRLLIVDHITSATAIVFPVQRIAQTARERGIAVLIDGAHAPGHVAFDVAAIGADWYAGNAHKWLFAPKGCGLLWTAPSRQEITRPTVLSHGAPDGYTQAFDWIGTRDVTPWLCFEAAAQFHARMGGESLMTRNRELVARASRHLAEELGMLITAPEAMRGAMTCLTARPSPIMPENASRVTVAVRECCGAVVPVYVFQNAFCVRISAQIYNTLSDYEALARVFPTALQQSV